MAKLIEWQDLPKDSTRVSKDTGLPIHSQIQFKYEATRQTGGPGKLDTVTLKIEPRVMHKDNTSSNVAAVFLLSGNSYSHSCACNATGVGGKKDPYYYYGSTGSTTPSGENDYPADSQAWVYGDWSAIQRQIDSSAKSVTLNFRFCDRSGYGNYQESGQNIWDNYASKSTTISVSFEVPLNYEDIVAPSDLDVEGTETVNVDGKFISVAQDELTLKWRKVEDGHNNKVTNYFIIATLRDERETLYGPYNIVANIPPTSYDENNMITYSIGRSYLLEAISANFNAPALNDYSNDRRWNYCTFTIYVQSERSGILRSPTSDPIYWNERPSAPTGIEYSVNGEDWNELASGVYLPYGATLQALGSSDPSPINGTGRDLSGSDYEIETIGTLGQIATVRARGKDKDMPEVFSDPFEVQCKYGSTLEFSGALSIEDGKLTVPPTLLDGVTWEGEEEVTITATSSGTSYSMTKKRNAGNELSIPLQDIATGLKIDMTPARTDLKTITIAVMAKAGDLMAEQSINEVSFPVVKATANFTHVDGQTNFYFPAYAATPAIIESIGLEYKITNALPGTSYILEFQAAELGTSLTFDKAYDKQVRVEVRTSTDGTATFTTTLTLAELGISTDSKIRARCISGENAHDIYLAWTNLDEIEDGEKIQYCNVRPYQLPKIEIRPKSGYDNKIPRQDNNPVTWQDECIYDPATGGGTKHLCIQLKKIEAPHLAFSEIVSSVMSNTFFITASNNEPNNLSKVELYFTADRGSSPVKYSVEKVKVNDAEQKMDQNLTFPFEVNKEYVCKDVYVYGESLYPGPLSTGGVPVNPLGIPSLSYLCGELISTIGLSGYAKPGTNTKITKMERKGVTK